MKRFLTLIALLTSPLLAMAANVGFNINLGDDNYYGPVQLEGMQPQLVYNSPVIIQRSRVAYPPLYLRVPPRYYSNWGAYCNQYNACNRPVYFISDDWYRTAYIPRYRQGHPRWHDRDYGRAYGPVYDQRDRRDEVRIRIDGNTEDLNRDDRPRKHRNRYRDNQDYDYRY
jgi:hypothetical protein